MAILLFVGLIALTIGLFLAAQGLAPDGIKLGGMQLKGKAAGGFGGGVMLLGAVCMAIYIFTASSDDGTGGPGNGRSGGINTAPENRTGVSGIPLDELVVVNGGEVDPSLRDAYKDVTTTRNAPDADRKGQHLNLFPPKSAWPDKRTPPADVKLDAWPFEVVKAGEVWICRLEGVVINYTGTDCRTLTLNAYCLDSYGRPVGSGGTAVRDIRAGDRDGVTFTIEVGGIVVDANKRPNVDHVVLTPGKAFWVSGY